MMADTQDAPQAIGGLEPRQIEPGSIDEAQAALLSIDGSDREVVETYIPGEKPRKNASSEEQPAEEEESQPQEEDESLEEGSEEEEYAEEAEEESEETEGEEEEELYAITVNGEEIEVNLEELRNGYSRQSDYTRKTQEIANNRKQMETLHQQYSSEVQKIQHERQQYMDTITSILASQGSELDKFANVDWDALRESDPIEYVTTREQYRETQERIEGLQDEQVRTSRLQQAQMNQAQQEMLQVEKGKLLEAIPEWGEPEKRQKLATSLQSYAREQGFTTEELNSLMDHRSVLVLLKAKKFDELDKSDVKTRKLKNKPRVIRSGKGSSERRSSKAKRTGQMKRLQDSGHIRDASSLFEDYVEI